MTRTTLALIALVASPALAGVTLTWERTTPGNGTHQVTMQCEGSKVRFDSTAKDGRAMLFDGDAIYILKGADKTYRKMDLKTLAGMKEKMAAAMANAPPEQRERMKAMM